MIKYLGSKRTLLPRIEAGVRSFPGVRRVLDLFSGTSRVGHALKRAGYLVHANDHLAYAHALGVCYVQADADRLREPARRVIEELRAVPPAAGYFTETFCERARFFHPDNGARIDAIRDRIERLGLEPELKAVVLVALMEAADRVDSTTGVQMAYLKQWAPRALKPLELRLPAILPGPGRATCLDALEAARGSDADLVYLDPPYNQHRYLGNYHIWETLVRGDRPEAYGVACKRADCRTYASAFNSRPAAHAAFAALVQALPARHLVVSFNDEGHIARAEMEALLRARGHVRVVAIDFPRYVGARIGIHNPRGEKVGTVSHVRTREFLYVVSDRAAVVRAAAAAVRAAARP